MKSQVFYKQVCRNLSHPGSIFKGREKGYWRRKWSKAGVRHAAHFSYARKQTLYFF